MDSCREPPRPRGNDAAPYVWTEKAEARARALGLEPRIAGTTAMYCGEPVRGDCENPMEIGVAYGWYKRGYIRRRTAGR